MTKHAPVQKQGAGYADETEAIQATLATLQSHNLDVSDLNTTGKLVRTKLIEGTKKGKKPGWYTCTVFRPTPKPGQEPRVYVVGHFGWWQGTNNHEREISIDDRGLTATDRARLRAEQLANRQKVDEERQAEAAQAAARAEKMLPGFKTEGRCGYLDKKKVRAWGDVRFAFGKLVLPLRHVETGKLHSLQFIPESGEKTFLSGSDTMGCVHWLVPPSADGTEPRQVVLSEGYATSATGVESRVFDADAPQACAFFASNLPKVTAALRRRWPAAEIVILADDDAFVAATIPPFVNDGRKYAALALKAAAGSGTVQAVYPSFGQDQFGRDFTDWNDLRRVAGLGEVRRQLMARGSAESAPPNEAQTNPDAVRTSLHEPSETPTAPVPPPSGPQPASDGDPSQEPPRRGRKAGGGGGARRDGSGNGGNGDDPGEPWRDSLTYGRDCLRSNSHNVIVVLTHHPDWQGVFALNRFSRRIEILRPPPYDPDRKPGPVTDTDEIETAAWFGHPDNFGATITAGVAREGMVVVGSRNAFHPVIEYLNGLVWDQEPRLATFFSDYCGVEQGPMSDAFARCFFLSMVARIRQPGCKADLMLVLEGHQGVLKSSLAQLLCPRPEWYLDLGIPPTDKDFYQLMEGKWLVELGEMAVFSKAEAAHIKRAISSKVDTYRPSYGRNSHDFPRECIFFGTVNETKWNRDHTGGRRYMPLWVTDIDLQAVASVRDQLWAEASARHAAGEDWWQLPPEAKAEQASRYEDDPWTNHVWRWLEGKCAADDYPKKFRAAVDQTTATEILIYAIGVELKKITRQEQTRAGIIMDRLGWDSKRVTRGGVKLTQYARPAGLPPTLHPALPADDEVDI